MSNQVVQQEDENIIPFTLEKYQHLYGPDFKFTMKGLNEDEPVDDASFRQQMPDAVRSRFSWISNAINTSFKRINHPAEYKISETYFNTACALNESSHLSAKTNFTCMDVALNGYRMGQIHTKQIMQQTHVCIPRTQSPTKQAIIFLNSAYRQSTMTPTDKRLITRITNRLEERLRTEEERERRELERRRGERIDEDEEFHRRYLRQREQERAQSHSGAMHIRIENAPPPDPVEIVQAMTQERRQQQQVPPNPHDLLN